jgi:hypothetical protein
MPPPFYYVKTTENIVSETYNSPKAQSDHERHSGRNQVIRYRLGLYHRRNVLPTAITASRPVITIIKLRTYHSGRLHPRPRTNQNDPSMQARYLNQNLRRKASPERAAEASNLPLQI